MKFLSNAKRYHDAEIMAADFLKEYSQHTEITFPINPFQMLNDVGIVFSVREFSKLEGVYIPANGVDDLPVVGINYKRPITRQRFTAAHELCHHFRDADKQIICPISNKNEIEKFADRFASALLMPYRELKRLVSECADADGNVSLDSVLQISDYFGVSFESCLFRIAYVIHAISGNTEPTELKRACRRFKPDAKRIALGMNNTQLYEQLINAYARTLSFVPSEHARLVFANEYLYNDSRMEGVEITQEAAAEIVTDLRVNMQNSIYCKEENEAFMSIAGHYAMYQEIFVLPVKKRCSVFDTMHLHQLLFSHYPYPEYGGKFRQGEPMVLGAKFETLPPEQIFPAMIELEKRVTNLFANRSSIPLSDYIEEAAQIHHALTVIHPFGDGNGRTLRAFLNVLFVRAGIVPVYVRVEEKEMYYKALEAADATGNFNQLYEVVFKAILRSSMDLTL